LGFKDNEIKANAALSYYKTRPRFVPAWSGR